MTTIIIIFLFYILPAILNWDWTIIAYSKNGIWSGLDAEFMYLFFALMPFINIIFSGISYFSDSSYEDGKMLIRFPELPKINFTYNKFFNIKK